MNVKNILLLLILFVFSCSNSQKEFSLTGADYIIDLDGKKEESIPLSTYFKTARTIILETNKDCLIGHINGLQAFDGCIYVHDMLDANSLFVFDMNGRFIRKIGNKGKGPGEYMRVSDFTLDTENKFIFLLDYEQRVHKYHLDGTYINTITPKMQHTNAFSIQYYRNKLYLSVKAFDPTPDDYMLLEVNPDDGTILSESLPVKDNKGWTRSSFSDRSSFISRSSDPPLYTQLFMDCIVTIGAEIKPYIELKSQNLTTFNDLENLPYDRDDPMKFFNALRNFSKIYFLKNYMESNDFIIFSYSNGSMDNRTAIYHKKTGSVKVIKKFHNDLIFGKDNNVLFGMSIFSDTKGAYEIIQQSTIETIQELIRNEEAPPRLDKVDEFMKLNEESNPVILYYEFK